MRKKYIRNSLCEWCFSDKNKANGEVNYVPKNLLAATVVLNILEKSFRLEVVILNEYDVQGRSFVYLLKLFCIIQGRTKQIKS